MTITRKIKIVKIWKLVLLSNEPISNLPCKFQKFQKKKILLRCSVATLFRSWLASLAVGLRTLASLVRAQRHSRIACYIVFRHRKIVRKIKFASLFCSYVVSELARFALGRIEDSSFNRFALNVIPELPAILFFGIEKCKKKKFGFWSRHHGFSSKSNFFFSKFFKFR